MPQESAEIQWEIYLKYWLFFLHQNIREDKLITWSFANTWSIELSPLVLKLLIMLKTFWLPASWGEKGKHLTPQLFSPVHTYITISSEIHILLFMLTISNSFSLHFDFLPLKELRLILVVFFSEGGQISFICKTNAPFAERWGEGVKHAAQAWCTFQ